MNTFESKMKIAIRWKETGNDAFKEHLYLEAKAYYLQVQFRFRQYSWNCILRLTQAKYIGCANFGPTIFFV